MRTVDDILKKSSESHSKTLQEKFRGDIQEIKVAALNRSDSDNEEKYKEARQRAHQQISQLKEAKGGYAEILTALFFASLTIWLDDMEKIWDRYKASKTAVKNAPWSDSACLYSIEMDNNNNINKLFAVDHRNATSFNDFKHQDQVQTAFLDGLKAWAREEPRKWELVEAPDKAFFRKEDGTKVDAEEFVREKNNPESSLHDFLKKGFESKFSQDMKLVDQSNDYESQELNQRPALR